MEERNPCRFSASSLSSVVSEWMLIFLLLLNGFFSYFVTKFARRNKLQTPCVLCSRFDHVLDSECPSFYENLMCTSHKVEFTSLSYCHIHQKLADIREMCESCLLSFSTNKSTSETYGSLVAKLEINHKLHDVDEADESRIKGEHAVRAPFLKNNDVIGLVKKVHCSCCNQPFRMRSHAHRLLQTKTVRGNAVESSSPILGLLDRSLSLSRNRDGLCKRKELLATPTPTPTPVSHGQCGFDQLAHVGYSELKITSDSESEMPISDDGDGNTLVHRSTNIIENDPPVVYAKTSPDAASYDGIGCEKMVHADLVLPDLLPAIDDEQVCTNEKTIPPAFILPVIEEKIHTVDADIIVPVLPVMEEQLDDSSVNAVKLHGLDELNWNGVEGDVPGFSGVACDPCAAVDVTKNFALTKASSDSIPPISMEIDLDDSYKLLIVAKGSQPSSKDAFQIQEDLRLLQAQIFQGLHSSQHDAVPTPRVRELLREDSRLSESASRTSGQTNLSRGPCLERNEFGGVESSSFDGSGIDEMDGESTADKPKKDDELDRKSMSLLYKELEEERSASAIAANQAMAMITRLQEEKAAMQMEAFQYQRLMEEQAEYDLDLLAEKEKEIEDLKAEIAIYRNTS